MPSLAILPGEVVHFPGGLPIVQAHGRLATVERRLAQCQGGVLIEPGEARGAFVQIIALGRWI
ncbi:hypothetical protein D3C76_1777910 [compost metagenome]